MSWTAGPHPRVVEVDEMRAVGGPQNVAGVTIAVQAQRFREPGAVEAMANTVKRHFRHRAIRFNQVRRHEVVRKKERARLVAESGDIDRGPRRKARERADGMQAPDETPHPFQGRGVVQFRRATAALGVHGEAETFEMMQGRSGMDQGCHRRNLPFRQFGDECMLFQDLRVGPA